MKRTETPPINTELPSLEGEAGLLCLAKLFREGKEELVWVWWLRNFCIDDGRDHNVYLYLF